MATDGLIEMNSNYPAMPRNRFMAGTVVEVSNPLESAANVRDTPGGAILGEVANGTRGELLAGPEQASLDGHACVGTDSCYIWWQVQFPGLIGWIVSPYLQIDSLDKQAQQDMINRAGHDLRFGAAIPVTFGTLRDWDPSWELRGMNFNFTAGRQAYIYHITNKSDASLRYTIFFDPDTGTWTNWEQALGPIDEQAIHDMVKRAARDQRFGPYIIGTFGKQLDWSNVAELQWIDFHFAGNRIVRIYQETLIQDVSVRYTVFWDPDTSQWANLEQAQ